MPGMFWWIRRVLVPSKSSMTHGTMSEGYGPMLYDEKTSEVKCLDSPGEIHPEESLIVSKPM